MARTYKTLSLSLPPGVVEELAMIGKSTGSVAARVAAQIVLREIAKLPSPKQEKQRSGSSTRRSWCCHARVIPVQGQLVVPETDDGERQWLPAIVLLCGTCRNQMHGREYEGWIAAT
jgi:hypothetical protein